MLYSTFNPVNDIFLIKTNIKKVKEVDYDTSDSGIFTGRKSVVDSRPNYGTIVKMGNKCPDGFKVNDNIHFGLEAGLDIIFDDEDNKYLLMGAEKFYGKINA